MRRSYRLIAYLVAILTTFVCVLAQESAEIEAALARKDHASEALYRTEQRMLLTKVEVSLAAYELMQLDWRSERRGALEAVSKAEFVVREQRTEKADAKAVAAAKKELDRAVIKLRKADLPHVEGLILRREELKGFVFTPQQFELPWYEGESRYFSEGGKATDKERKEFRAAALTLLDLDSVIRARERLRWCRQGVADICSDLKWAGVPEAAQRQRALEITVKEKENKAAELEKAYKDKSAGKERTDLLAELDKLNGELREERRSLESLQDGLEELSRGAEIMSLWFEDLEMIREEDDLIWGRGDSSASRERSLPADSAKVLKMGDGDQLRVHLNSAKLLDQLGKVENLKSLTVTIGSRYSGYTVSAEWVKSCIRQIAKHTGLLKLQLSFWNGGVTSSSLEPLLKLKALGELDVHIDEITPKTFELLSRIEVSKSMSFSGAFTGKNWDEVSDAARVSPVNKLSVTFGPSVNSRALCDMLGVLPSLKTLKLDLPEDVKVSAFAGLSASRSLKKVIVGGVHNGEQLRVFSRIEGLEELSLTLSWEASPIDDESLAVLDSHGSLKRLGLANCPYLSVRSLETLESIKGLTQVDLRMCVGIPEWAVHLYQFRRPECSVVPAIRLPLE